MCTEVYNLFGDTSCQHKEYQNTFPCHVAKRCGAGDDQLLLKETVFLPTRPPNVPPGLLGCKVRKATRPVAGKCRDCTRGRTQAADGSTSNSLTMRSSTPVSSTNSVKSTARRLFTPTPSSRALAQMRDSFLQVSRAQQVTPPRTGMYRGKAGV
ncbi:hypothetical protein F5B22DRAFT_599712 [Xylaria bambusicola]|uniref:uncharacterized protein n=1 Tax=Xylaria bambusicola TaxID=326684 RepID=UPI002008D81C|nr:uncharacterized protein F5B22DRAFT_599712 [Xylaria bambusicola]KAI0518562.1 hypothetical protein F5B22DRAFT_599712 [Xylaria bambusicola]